MIQSLKYYEQMIDWATLDHFFNEIIRTIFRIDKHEYTTYNLSKKVK